MIHYKVFEVYGDYVFSRMRVHAYFLCTCILRKKKSVCPMDKTILSTQNVMGSNLTTYMFFEKIMIGEKLEIQNLVS